MQSSIAIFKAPYRLQPLILIPPLLPVEFLFCGTQHFMALQRWQQVFPQYFRRSGVSQQQQHQQVSCILVYTVVWRMSVMRWDWDGMGKDEKRNVLTSGDSRNSKGKIKMYIVFDQFSQLMWHEYNSTTVSMYHLCSFPLFFVNSGIHQQVLVVYAVRRWVRAGAKWVPSCEQSITCIKKYTVREMMTACKAVCIDVTVWEWHTRTHTHTRARRNIWRKCEKWGRRFFWDP